MTQKPTMLRDKVGARALRVRSVSRPFTRRCAVCVVLCCVVLCVTDVCKMSDVNSKGPRPFKPTSLPRGRPFFLASYWGAAPTDSRRPVGSEKRMYPLKKRGRWRELKYDTRLPPVKPFIENGGYVRRQLVGSVHREPRDLILSVRSVTRR